MLSVIVFAWIWLKATGLNAAWLLLIVLSWDVAAAASGGNVELVLLTATLAAARLLWSSQPVGAAPLVALVIVLKPFYALFFAGFGALMLSSRSGSPAVSPCALLAAAALTAAFLGLEFYRWGPHLRTETLEFMTSSLEHQWFVLPVAEQTPMSIWNRTPMQGLVNAGLPPDLALFGAFGAWLALTAITAWQVSRRAVGFPRLFALAFVLLYWGRPVGWTLNYLEIVVVGAVWPVLDRRLRFVVLAGAAALMMSHWAALMLTLGGVTLSLFTLQSAECPWETWSVVPVAWVLLLHSARNEDRAACHSVTAAPLQ